MNRGSTLRLFSAELEALIDAKVRRAVADALRVDEFLTPAEAAKLARVNPQTIRKWVKVGKLKRLTVGKVRIRVSRNELERLIKRGVANDESPEEMAAKAFG
jgi:excisionase family DNA binding protein